MAFGVVLRLIRYLSNRPLWGDEAMVAVNVLDRGFVELLDPLSFHQVAPIGFLWAERLMVELLGASEWSLRLAPIVCGILSIPIFAWWARRAVSPVAALLALAVLAVSYAPLRHAVEVKPYAFDLLASVALMGPAILWLKNADRSWVLWSLVLLAPIAMFFSHPAAFVAGGIGLALLPTLWRQSLAHPELRLRCIWTIYLGVVGLSFLGVYALSTGDQSEAVGHAYRFGYWSEAFPPVGEPIRLSAWFVMTHVGEAFGYPLGGEDGASVVSTVLAIVGGITLWRGRQRALLLLLLAPLGMTLLAALLGRYPYGGAARTMQHVAPMICLLIGVGAAGLLLRETDGRRQARHFQRIMLFLGLIGLTLMTIDLARPYRTLEDQRTRDFAQWFWPEVAREAEVGCSRAMRGSIFDGYYWRLGRLELYLANRAIALPGDRDLARPRLDRVSDDHPLRIVVYNDDPRFDLGLASWLDVMSLCFQLRDVRSYTVNEGVIDDGMGREERFLVFEYVPRPEEEELNLVSGG